MTGPDLPQFSNALLLRLALSRNEGLAVTRADAHISKDLLWSELDGSDVRGLIGDLLLEFLPWGSAIIIRGGLYRVQGKRAIACLTYQVVINTLVELPLSRAALPQLMISVVEALPVFAELGKAVSVDVLDAVVS
jgi:hypothetical protein